MVDKSIRYFTVEMMDAQNDVILLKFIPLTLNVVGINSIELNSQGNNAENQTYMLS